MKVNSLVIIGSLLEYFSAVLVWIGVLYAGMSLVTPGSDDSVSIILPIVVILFATLCAVAFFCWIMVRWFVWAHSKTENASLLYTMATSNGLYLTNDAFLMHFATRADRQRIREIMSRVRAAEESGEVELEVTLPIVYRTSSLVPITFRLIWMGLTGELFYLAWREGYTFFALACALLIVYLLYRIAQISAQPSLYVKLDRDSIRVGPDTYAWTEVSNLRTDVSQLTNRYLFCFDVGSETISVNTLIMNADAYVVLAQATMLWNQGKQDRK